MQHTVDLSSFPLLRIDQLPQHELQTLVESEVMLSKLAHEGDIESISPFITKLLTHVRKEISHRGGKEAGSISLNVHSQYPISAVLPAPARDCPDPCEPTTNVMDTPERMVKQTQSETRRACSPSPSFVVFSSPKLKSSNFRSRARHAKAALRERSDEAVSLRIKQERYDRTRRNLGTFQEWRMEREKARKLREERLNEERRLGRERRNAMIARQTKVQFLMHAAAEDAKSKALELGCTNEEALVEAAAAASRVVDDESTSFQSTDTQSDDGSFTYDECSDKEHLPPLSPSTDFVQAVDNGKCSNTNSFEAGCSLQPCISAESPTKSFCQEELQSLSSKTFDSDQNINICGGDETIGNHLTVAATTELAACPTDWPKISSIQHDSSSRLQDLHVDGDTTSTYSEMNTETLPNAVDAIHDQNLSYNHAQEQYIPVPAINESQMGPFPLEMKSTAAVSPVHEATQIQSATVHDMNIRVETKSTKIFPTRDRQSRKKLPSFLSIFANNASNLMDTITADAKQRELTRLFLHHIEQYTMMKTFFSAPTEDARCQSEDDSSDCSADSFARGLFYRIDSHRPEVMSIIRTAFSDRQLSAWNELPPDVEANAWNLLWVWGMPMASTFDNLLVFQKINRFRDTRGLTRKDLLKKNIQRFCNCASTTKDEESFNIMPLTFALPHEFASFVSGYQSVQKNLVDKSANYWIIKPIGLSRGRGISIVNDIADVSYSRPVVIQRYITNPFCFMGFKFDLRMYILVTSFSPLEAFIYKEGLARFGSKPYSLNPELLHDRRIHLTNSSVQQEYSDDIDKSHPAYLAGAHGFESKAAFTWLWKRLEALGVDTNDLWVKLTDVCRYTLLAAGSDIQYQPNSFEIFGYDLMFDQHLKCWLIEVNSSPSLACDSPLDTRIKGSLIRDTVALVNPPAYDRKVLSTICQRRMTQRHSAAKNDSDVDQVLMHAALREVGEMPKRIGNYERLFSISNTPLTHN